MESVETVMIVDGGARGQATAKKLADEGLDVVVSPGNPGNEDFAISTGVVPTDVAGQLKAARSYDIDLTIVGGEDPLDLGIVDEFQAAGHTIFGPTQDQAKIETDRRYAKGIAKKLNIPMGEYGYFTARTREKAREFAVNLIDWPVYVKDNGPAQGKGATPCQNVSELEGAISQLDSFVIESYIPGPELSHHSFCDGNVQMAIPVVVRDHKTLPLRGNAMTGGMGVIGPIDRYDSTAVEELGEKFAAPLVRELGFKGMLFSGLKGAKGEERALEWNVRPGDPEMQVFLRLMKSDLLPYLMACVEGGLDAMQPPHMLTGKFVVNSVLATQGYPGRPEPGLLIEGLEQATQVDGVQVLQAATKRENNQLYTDGGRVINLVSTADSPDDARKQALKALEPIKFNGLPPLVRRDILQHR